MAGERGTRGGESGSGTAPERTASGGGREDLEGPGALAGQARELSDEALLQASRWLERVRRHGLELLDEEREQVARELGRLGGAVRRAARALEERDRGSPAADCIAAVAGRIDGAARYLAESSPSRLVEDARGLARRRPGLLLGGLLLAGFALERTLGAGTAGDREARTGAADEPA